MKRSRKTRSLAGRKGTHPSGVALQRVICTLHNPSKSRFTVYKKRTMVSSHWTGFLKVTQKGARQVEQKTIHGVLAPAVHTLKLEQDTED